MTYSKRFLRPLTLALLLTQSLTPHASAAKPLPILTVAFMAPMSGPLANMGTEVHDASALILTGARLEFRKLGFDLRFKTLDDQGSPELGATLARALSQDPNVMGLIGPGLSGVALPVTEILSKSNIPVLTVATLSSVTSRGLNNTFRVIASDVSSAKAASEYLVNTLGVKTVLVVDDGAAYGIGMSKVITAALEARGVSVIGRVSLGTTSVESVLEGVVKDKPDALYFAGGYDKAASMVRGLRAKRLDTLFFGGELLSFPGFLTSAGDAAVGTLYTSATAPAAGYSSAVSFLKRYSSQYKKPASGIAVLGHDAVGTLLEALRDAISNRAGVKPTRADVLHSLASVKYNGFSGPLEFSESGERRSSTVFVLKVVEDGTLRVVGSLSAR